MKSNIPWGGWGLVLCIAATFWMIPSPPAWAGQSVTLSWNPDTDPGVAGYMVHWGYDSCSCSSRTNVGTNTTVTISGLVEGSTNYFAVAAYNSANVEGPLSADLVYIVPGLLRVTRSGVGSTASTSISFPVAPGHWYEILASNDLKSWTSIYATSPATSNAWTTYQDSQAGTKWFYRLRSH